MAESASGFKEDNATQSALPTGHGSAPPPARKSKGFDLLSKLSGGWILSLGLALFLAANAGQVVLKGREAAQEPGPSNVREVPEAAKNGETARNGETASNQESRRPRFSIWLDGLIILSKELGGVLIVGYLVQELIESRHQEAWQKDLERRVEDTLRPAIAEVRFLNEDLGITLRNKLVIEDEDARKELTNKVLRPDFIRRQYKLRLTLESTPTDGLIKVSTETEYVLENVSDDDLPYCITGWIDTARDQWLPGVEPGKFTFLTFGPESLKAEDSHRPTDLDPSRNNLVQLHSTDESLVLKYPIHPNIPKHSRYFINLIAVQYMQTHDQFVWVMVHVTEGLDVVIRLGGTLTWDNFKVTPRLLHHQDEFQDPHPPLQNGQRTWSLKNILLPYQGVQIWWSPQTGKQDRPDDTAQA